MSLDAIKTMRDITGTDEYEGGADNPNILAWRDEIAQRFPDMAAYCANYTHDSIPWCGLTVAYCMAHNGIRPVYGSGDLERFLWARAWTQFGDRVDLDQAQPGDVIVFDHHVALFERLDGDRVVVRGGNQGNSVNEMRMPRGSVLAVRRAGAAAAQPSTKPTNPRAFRNVTATMFGGPSDAMSGALTAYGNTLVPPGWWDRPGVALPARINQRPLPQVRVSMNGKSVICPVIDVGPWNTKDPYWETGARPQAESGVDLFGRKTNRAGIDLTPAAARAIGLAGKGVVDWEFVTDDAVVITTPQVPISIDAQQLMQLAMLVLVAWPYIKPLLEDLMSQEDGMPDIRQPVSAPAVPTAAAPGKLDFAKLIEVGLPILLKLLQPQTATPAAPAPVVVPVPAPAPTNTVGTGFGILGVIGTLLGAVLGVNGAPVGEGATLVGQILPLVFGGISALGATGKIGWALQIGKALLTVITAARAPK